MPHPIRLITFGDAKAPQEVVAVTAKAANLKDRKTAVHISAYRRRAYADYTQPPDYI